MSLTHPILNPQVTARRLHGYTHCLHCTPPVFSSANTISLGEAWCVNKVVKGHWELTFLLMHGNNAFWADPLCSLANKAGCCSALKLILKTKVKTNPLTFTVSCSRQDSVNAYQTEQKKTFESNILNCVCVLGGGGGGVRGLCWQALMWFLCTARAMKFVVSWGSKPNYTPSGFTVVLLA